MKKVFVAGHRGLAGTATLKVLRNHPDKYDIITKSHDELDLEDAAQTAGFFQQEKPEYVVVCAAKVGGILANSKFPVEFLHRNLRIQLNVFDAAFAAGVDRLIFLGSSCIYPRDCPQPIREDYLLTGPLEGTNRAYALAKIAGVESCWSFNRQYGTKYLSLMPTNMYGPGDNYHPEHSHVLPALLRRLHEAKLMKIPEVGVWGSGSPRREFMYSLDLGAAIEFLLRMPDATFARLTDDDRPPLINVGTGVDITIRELAYKIREVVSYQGELIFDHTKPDGTPQKLLDVSRLRSLGWSAETPLDRGIQEAYEDFLQKNQPSELQ